MTMLNAPSHWRRYKELYNLQGSSCRNCGQTFFPARKICPNCRRDGKIEALYLTGKGMVYTYTVIRTPPEGFEEYAPYILALVKLDEGPTITSQVVNCSPEKLFIGMLVETCFRKLRVQNKEGIIIYGFKFKPVDGALKH
ncbi:Zn-ribbon domain-containing OB-fold protein [Candidatus Bathyarchaeota archaeon]|nr:Zn-ribbon domain-containing OB-fold protein [Candidatus Bathyarchaeota archaeon]